MNIINKQLSTKKFNNNFNLTKLHINYIKIITTKKLY